jgi:hypothetical protein
VVRFERAGQEQAVVGTVLRVEIKTERMMDKIRSLIQSAEAKRAEKLRQLQGEADQQAAEIGIVQRFEFLSDRAGRVKEDFQVLSKGLAERYGQDFLDLAAQRLANNSAQVDALGMELASALAFQTNLPKILEKFGRLTVGQAEADLAAFTKEHSAILRSYKII